MTQKLHKNIKKFIKVSEIKNFKTQKFKHRPKDQQPSHYLPIHIQHRHHPLQHNCTTNFNLLRIYQVLSPSSFLSNISLVQITFSLQLSIVSSSCFKMYLLFILLLSISSNHIIDCQRILESDSNIIFFSKNNNFSGHILQYVKSKHNIINKRLIEDKIVKYEKEAHKSINNPLETTTVFKTIDAIDVWWSDKNQDTVYEHRDKKDERRRSNNISYNGYSKESNNQTSVKRILLTPDALHINRIHVQNYSTSLGEIINKKHLLQIVMDGLGLQNLPDLKKANISQAEYAQKYNEYLNRVRERKLRELHELGYLLDQFDLGDSNSSLSLISIPHNYSEAMQYRKRRSPNKNRTHPKKTILLRFPLNIESELESSDIEEANIRLLLITNPALASFDLNKRRHRARTNRGNVRQRKPGPIKLFKTSNSTDGINKAIKQNKTEKHVLNMKVYQLLEPKGRVWIDGRKIEIKIDRKKIDETTSQWLQFDVTKAVESWLVNKQNNLGLEIQCDNCFQNGARIIDDISGDSEEDVNATDKYNLTPVLNIIGRLGTHREKRSKHHHHQMTEKPERRHRKSNCYKDNQRCCRHTMEVVFKEIKGFEFIIQPKAFDAGYCKGRCPPRYNPANHHALLQSLIWKQDRTKVPRPCCAPSKLIELEVLHVDEKDNEKLKISTWTDMRVQECACS